MNKGLKAGIYFNLSNKDYHNDPAISCSGVKLLLDCPTKYWWNSPLNPNRKTLDTKALRIGRLYHNLLLEPEKFGDEFLVLKKGEQFKSYLKENNLELEDVAHLTQIREPDILEAQEAIKEIKDDPLYQKWFKGGYPEVSIFWEDQRTGLMCRCCFDYLNSNFGDDYKTTLDVGQVKSAIASYDYNLQAAIYLRGLAALLSSQDIVISGNDEQKEWFKSFKENLSNDFKFRFLFQEKIAPYISRSITLGNDILEPSTIIFENALNIYLENFKKYGVKKWGSGYDETEEITLFGTSKMSQWWGIKLEEQANINSINI